MNQHRFHNPIDARPAQVNGAECNVFDLALHRAEFEVRFANVDDVFARLSSDPRVIIEDKAKG